MNQSQSESHSGSQSVTTNADQNERSPESERRRNKGKLWRDAGDKASWRMLDVSARMTHKNEIANAANLVDPNQMMTALAKEDKRHKQYEEGKKSGSPVKQVDKRPG